MAAYCRICHRNNEGDTDTLIACNNCGSLACDKHHSWFSTSKDAFCEECYPKQAAGSLNKSADAIQAVFERNMIGEYYRIPILNTLEKLKLPPEILIKILRELAFAILAMMDELESRRSPRDDRREQ